MKKSFVILLHVGFWFCYFMLIFIMLSVYYRSSAHTEDQAPRIINALKSLFFFAFIPSVLSYFLNYFLLFPRYLQQKKYFLSILVWIGIAAGAAIVGYIMLRFYIESGNMKDMDNGGKNGRSTALTVIVAMILIGSISGVVALIIKGFVTWVNEIKLKENFREKNHQMEMALIKSQLDPHLLFNTINNIDALILNDSVAASEYLNKLSDIMRFILYETKPDKILLSKEIEYIGKYISLQKIRTANENYVHFSVTGIVGTKSIAPMVFIPFIENAFKHANNKKLENAIMVSIHIMSETVQLVCENKFDQKMFVPDDYGGLGNNLIKKRLDLIYGGKQKLAVTKTDERYCIDLTIPYE
jgi:two-component system LytT family sensor kinase